MELQIFVNQERVNIFLVQQISARRGHGFHTRLLETHLENFSKETLAKFFTNEII